MYSNVVWLNDKIIVFSNYPQIDYKTPVDCVWGAYDAWSTCSKTCGGGVQIRTRKVDTVAENGGTACTGLSSEQQDCSTSACPSGNFTILVLVRQFSKNTYKIVDKIKFVYL